MLVHQGEVKLLDFGIAVETRVEAGLAGTVEYMAPELFLGRPPSQVTDLYSVGVLAYQMLTGVFPYSRDSMTEMLQGILGTRSDMTIPPNAMRLLGHFQSRPRLLSADFEEIELGSALPDNIEQPVDRWRSEVKGPLGEIVRKLVTKSSAERYGNAQAVLRDLVQVVGGEISIETAATRESFLQATAFAGRRDEIDSLTVVLAKAAGRQGNGVLVGGESGVGKSRLVSELRTYALIHGFWVIEGQSTTEAGAYYQEWIPLLRGLGFRSELSDVQTGVFSQVVDNLAGLLGRQLPPLPVVPPEVFKERLAQALIDTLRGLSKPVLIVLEDLQWARSESLDLLNRMLNAIGDLPVLLVGTYRTEEAPTLPAQLDSMQSIRLERLRREGIEQLSESILGEIGKQESLVAYLAQQTEGNIFFLIEVIRALAEDAGELQRIGQGELPETVFTLGIERIVERRIEHIDSAFRNVLAFAATMGRQLDLAVLEHAFPEVPLRLVLLQCANAAVLESQGSDWRFAHDKLREAFLRRQSAAAGQKLHLQVAEALEVTYALADRDRISAQLALHFHRAEQLARAIPYDVQAGDRSARLGLLAEARAHYRDALDALGQLPDTLDHRRQRIELLIRLIQNTLTADALDVQLQRVGEAQTHIDLLSMEQGRNREVRLCQARLDYFTGRIYYYAGKSVDAIRLYRQVLPDARELGDPELIAMPSAVIGQALALQGNMKNAFDLLSSARGLLAQLGNEFELLRCQSFIGYCLAGMGHYVQGLLELKECLRVATKQNHKFVEFLSRLLMAMSHAFAMDWPAMLAILSGLDAMLLRSGEKIYAMIVWIQESLAHAHLGNWELSHQLTERIRITKNELGGKVIAVDLFEAWHSDTLLLAARYEDALGTARSILERFGNTAHCHSVGIAERVIAASLSHLGGAPAEVDAYFRRSIDSFAKGQNQLYISQAELSWGNCCARRRDRPAALEHFGLAQTIFRDASCQHALASVERQIAEQS